MKPYLLLLPLFLLAACTSQTQISPTNTPKPLINQSPEPTDIVPVVPATTSSTPLAPTQQPIATNDDVLFTSTPVTSTSEPTSTHLPVPTGRIVFLWNPYLIPPDDQRGVDEITRTNLYSVVPDRVPDNWQFETVMEMIGQPTMTLAPDRSKLAIIKYDDTNEDGFIDTRRGYDVTNIYTYVLDSGLFTPLTDNQFSTLAMSWSSDGQGLFYSQLNELFFVTLHDPQTLSSLLTLPGYIYNHDLSPDGRLLVILHATVEGSAQPPHTTELSLWDIDSEELISLVRNTEPDVNVVWSPNNQWLSFTSAFGRGLSLIQVKTLEVIELVPSSDFGYPVWSLDGQQLAYTWGSTLFLWDSQSLTIQQLITKDYLSQPSWSPDGTELAVGFSEGGRGGILILNRISDEWRELSFESPAYQIIWSPDGEWLLFSSYLEGKTGLFIVNLTVGEPYLFLDTTGKNFPYDIFWLENS